MAFQPVSPQELLQAAKALSPDDLNLFIDEVLSLRASMHTVSVSHAETQLLQQINASLPATMWQRYRQLIQLRQQERLSEAEYSELLQLSDTIETYHVQRMAWLAELATLRGQSLDQVMDHLNIKPMSYA